MKVFQILKSKMHSFSLVLRVDLDPQMSFYDEGQPGNLRVILSYIIAQDFSVDVNGCKLL